ncbi:15774_t:CDS:2 [Racocetra persica]|uniref:15774_t:CDS:1 n=1 Tax=Racocetra persica TaxID=160502 RepID=A0ACA9LH80_9GLOM|nr:15774_t:CDS:2 [Racocetra persica]
MKLSMKLSILILVALTFTLTVNSSPIIERRRFGREHTPEADSVYDCMKAQVLGAGIELEAAAGALVNASVFALLVKAGACDQQNAADQCLDLADRVDAKFESNKEGKARKKALTKCCVTYRQLERNTNGDGVASANCTEAPRHKILEGLAQAQDPTGLKTTAGFSGESPTDTPTTSATPTKKPKKNPKKKNPKTEPTPSTTPTAKPKDSLNSVSTSMPTTTGAA